MTTTDDCPIEARSARGYCPDDWQGHLDEVCGLDPSAPFCAGPSLRECPDGTEVPETDACPATGIAEPDEVEASCETDGSCDDSCTPPARGDCTAEVVQPAPPPAELPATGTPADLALTAAVLLAAGASLLTRTRRTR